MAQTFSIHVPDQSLQPSALTCQSLDPKAGASLHIDIEHPYISISKLIPHMSVLHVRPVSCPHLSPPAPVVSTSWNPKPLNLYHLWSPPLRTLRLYLYTSIRLQVQLHPTALFPDGTIPYKITTPLLAATAPGYCLSFQLVPPALHAHACALMADDDGPREGAVRERGGSGGVNGCKAKEALMDATGGATSCRPSLLGVHFSDGSASIALLSGLPPFSPLSPPLCLLSPLSPSPYITVARLCVHSISLLNLRT